MFCAHSTVCFLPSSFFLPSNPMPYQSVMPRGITGCGYRALHSGTHRWCVALSICLSSAVCLWSCRVSFFSSLVHTCTMVVRHAGLGGFCCGMLHSGTDMPGTLAFLLLWQCSDTSTIYLISPPSFMPFSVMPGGLAGLCYWGAVLIIALVLIFCYVALVMSPVTPGS